MRRPTLPEITETKETLNGARKVFRCRLVEQTSTTAVLLFVSESPIQVGDLTLAAGTVTFGFFWANRPYNVYHWMTPSGRTLGHYFNVADSMIMGTDALSWRDLTVDLLALPGDPLRILDEDELPADLDPALRTHIDRAKDEILGSIAPLIQQIEAASRRLWPHVFGEPRA